VNDCEGKSCCEVGEKCGTRKKFSSAHSRKCRINLKADKIVFLFLFEKKQSQLDCNLKSSHPLAGASRAMHESISYSISWEQGWKLRYSETISFDT
jgi:hypothetical protein